MHYDRLIDGIDPSINSLTQLINGLTRLINGWGDPAWAMGPRPGPPAINQPSDAIN